MKGIEFNTKGFLFNINEDLRIKGVIRTAKNGVRFINISHPDNETMCIFETQGYLLNEIILKLGLTQIQLQEDKSILDLLCYLVNEDTYSIYKEVYSNKDALLAEYLAEKAYFYEYMYADRDEMRFLFDVSKYF